MIKKYLLWIAKAIISGMIAVVLLTGFSMLYYNLPVHFDTEDGSTDYSWETNKFYSRGTEGFALGKTNNEGYLNSYDYTDETEVDILVMGSSHAEGYNVAMDESTAAVLGSLLPDRTVYNIGMSGHTFMRCADNLSSAIAKYSPSQYVIIETYSLDYTEDELIEAINEEVPHLPSYSGGIIGLMQKIPYFRLLYSQLEGFMGGAGDADTASDTPKTKIIAGEEAYGKFFEKLKSTADEGGVQLIIVYHPKLTLTEDGGVTFPKDNELLGMYSELCEKNGIKFLDMTQRFEKEYEEKHILPHGFSNTSVGSGHLNKNGHAMIAESLCELIKEEK